MVTPGRVWVRWIATWRGRSKPMSRLKVPPVITRSNTRCLSRISIRPYSRLACGRCTRSPVLLGSNGPLAMSSMKSASLRCIFFSLIKVSVWRSLPTSTTKTVWAVPRSTLRRNARHSRLGAVRRTWLKVSVRFTWALSNCRVRLSILYLIMLRALRRSDRTEREWCMLSASIWW